MSSNDKSFDKNQKVSEIFSDSIPEPRPAKQIGKSLDWLRGKFYFNFQLKKKYTPTS